MSQIQIFKGQWSETCTNSNNLTANQLKKPIIRDILEYAEPRMLSTMIVAGAKTPWDLKIGRTDVARTKIGMIPKDKLIGDSGYRYQVMGRIQTPSVVISQVGSTAADGTFQLIMQDQMLYPGMVVKFYSDNFYARVMGMPDGSPGSWLYTFKSLDGQLFDWSTMVAPQTGEKLAFGAYTTYSQRSLRGYSRTFYPSTFINHLTTQRKSTAISGSALTDVTWVSFEGTKGWYYTQERQMKLQFMMEDEHSKWDGVSTMKNLDGSPKDQPDIIDPETGESVIAGDGMLPQISGVNDAISSNPDGTANTDDFTDMMTALEKYTTQVYGNVWYVVTGTEGYGNAQTALRNFHVNNMGGRVTVSPTGTMVVGGVDIPVGGNFDTFNVNGNQLIFCKNPLWSDDQRFMERNSSSGKLIRDNMYLFVAANTTENGNMEILTKGAYGINRSNVSGYINGITGNKENPMLNATDALEYHMLKEDGFFHYNTKACGILRMPRN